MTDMENGVNQPEANSGHDYSMPTPHANTADDFGLGVIGPATLSVAVSRIAVDKATNADTQQFANFELREAIAVTDILTNLNVPAATLSTEGQSLVETLQKLPAGAEFDKIYITAQIANHEFLRDLAESYLGNSTGEADAAETHGRNLAALALTAFKEHVVLSKNILQATA